MRLAGLSRIADATETLAASTRMPTHVMIRIGWLPAIRVTIHYGETA